MVYYLKWMFSLVALILKRNKLRSSVVYANRRKALYGQGYYIISVLPHVFTTKYSIYKVFNKRLYNSRNKYIFLFSVLGIVNQKIHF